MFAQQPSPFYPLFCMAMTKIFEKSRDVKKVGKTRPNNASGYAITGALGEGKTNALRTFTILGPQILSNVITVYIDYQCFKQNPPTPFELIREACLNIGISHSAEVADLNSLLGLIELEGYSILFCADEISSIYSNSSIWSELHMLATNYYTTVLLADSSSRMEALIEGDSHREEILSFGYPEVQPSLNSTKLQLYRFASFTTVDQYRAFFAHRTEREFTELELRGMHCWTGGRIRDIMRLLSGSPFDSGCFHNRDTLPRSGTLESYVLENLRVMQDHKGYFDPFQLVTVPSASIMAWIKEWMASHCECKPKSINDLVKNHVIGFVDGDDAYSFDSPWQYIQLSKYTPKLFISHAEEDGEAVKRIATEISSFGIVPIQFQSPASKAAISEIGFRNGWRGKWLQNRCSTTAFSF